MRLASLSPRYCVVLSYLASVERASWKEVKGELEAKEKRSLPNPTVADATTGLIKVNFVEETGDLCALEDPLLRTGQKEEPVPW